MCYCHIFVDDQGGQGEAQVRHTSKPGALQQLIDDHRGRGEAEVAICASKMLSD